MHVTFNILQGTLSGSIEEFVCYECRHEQGGFRWMLLEPAAVSSFWVDRY